MESTEARPVRVTPVAEHLLASIDTSSDGGLTGVVKKPTIRSGEVPSPNLEGSSQQSRAEAKGKDSRVGVIEATVSTT